MAFCSAKGRLLQPERPPVAIETQACGFAYNLYHVSRQPSVIVTPVPFCLTVSHRSPFVSADLQSAACQITDLQSVNCFNQCRYVDYKSTLTIVRIANPHGRCFCPTACVFPAFALTNLAPCPPLF